MPRDEHQEAAYRSADLNAMETGLFSDCVRVVTCGPKTWNLHRVTLCSRSLWFEKALTKQFQEGCQAAVNVPEQDPDAVEVCIKYIYGGVASIDMARELETRGQKPFKFCALLYRSADFFMLKPLYDFVERYLGNHFDDRIKWLCTTGDALDDFYKEQKGREWVEDLKDAILEAEHWNTPIINNMLKEFVWAGRCYLAHTPSHTPHLDILEWLDANTHEYMRRLADLCRVPVWRTESTGPA
ncbi:hypothetical protein DHEL01_v204471 [Diaporthe helianthi]|uniref:BTB domain-containing protein n=1 Tax=Diaporthe helianthi TaxID=158607 RepID=A0A2P5I3P9_DIAHE|nr:hypothetical protein DHEL01_v204471 [Diaporthe helianthi]